MGTRSLTFIYETRTVSEPQPLMCMYKQMDGYPSGYGKNLFDFLKDFTIINGMGNLDPDKKYANGAGCLAAQLVAHFKTDVGGFYLYPTNTYDVGEQYTYDIFPPEINEFNDKQIWHIEVSDSADEVIFAGDLQEFGKFCEKHGD